jgi:hypothetical protein
VAADGRLRELKDRSQLIDGELVPLEGEQQPAPRWVGEGGHLSEEGRRGQTINPFIRIKGYNRRARKSTTRELTKRILPG